MEILNVYSRRVLALIICAIIWAAGYGCLAKSLPEKNNKQVESRSISSPIRLSNEFSNWLLSLKDIEDKTKFVINAKKNNYDLSDFELQLFDSVQEGGELYVLLAQNDLQLEKEKTLIMTEGPFSEIDDKEDSDELKEFKREPGGAEFIALASPAQKEETNKIDDENGWLIPEA